VPVEKEPKGKNFQRNKVNNWRELGQNLKTNEQINRGHKLPGKLSVKVRI